GTHAPPALHFPGPHRCLAPGSRSRHASWAPENFSGKVGGSAGREAVSLWGREPAANRERGHRTCAGQTESVDLRENLNGLYCPSLLSATFGDHEQILECSCVT